MFTTITAARAAVTANSDYLVTGDTAKARTFLVACTDLMVLMRQEQQGPQNGGMVADDWHKIEALRKECLDWLICVDPTFKAPLYPGYVIAPDFTNSRGVTDVAPWPAGTD